MEKLSRVVAAELASGSKPSEKGNMVRQILNSSLPDEDKSFWRLSRECASVTLAGTETTGSFLSITTFYLLSQPEILERLRKEIGEAEVRAGGKTLTLQELRELPYLVRFENPSQLDVVLVLQLT
jgi:cytochrome P450